MSLLVCHSVASHRIPPQPLLLRYNSKRKYFKPFEVYQDMFQGIKIIDSFSSESEARKFMDSMKNIRII